MTKKTEKNIKARNKECESLYKETGMYKKASALFNGVIDARTGYNAASTIAKATNKAGIKAKKGLSKAEKIKKSIMDADRTTRENKYKHLGPTRGKFNAAVAKFIPNPIF
jgi:hypothetical protein